MIKEQLESLNSVVISMGPGGLRVMNIILALIMFGVALSIKTDMFKNVFKQPKAVIIGLCMQWFALPAVTFILALGLSHWITPMVALGMILVASCPGGNISNFMSSYSKGNTELSVSMTAITTMFSSIMTPFNFFAWGSLYYWAISVSGDVPRLVIPFFPMLKEILLLLGVPIVLGMAFAHYFPKVTSKIVKPIQNVSFVLFILIVGVMIFQNWKLISGNILFVFLIVLIHNALALSTGYIGGTLGKVSIPERRSLTIEIGIQNTGLGLILMMNPAIFPPEIWNGHYGAMLLIASLWGIWHIISGLTISSIFRRTPLVKA